jgi:serine/threonine-protein kinase
MEEVIRRFDIGACLGRGGFGEVYRARMRGAGGLQTDVALKVLRSDVAADADAVERLRDEGRMLARCDHPSIVRVLDLCELEGRVVLVTELVEGLDLHHCFVGDDPLPLRAQLEVISAVADALDVAGLAHLVHRDVKPSNIRVSRHGQVKLLDFGIATTPHEGRATNATLGSPAYMAPERFLDAEARPEGDVFALGCCLYEGMSGGRRLFENVPRTVMSAIAADRRRYEAHIADRLEALDACPASVIALLRSTLAYEPERRPTPHALAHACDPLADAIAGPTLTRWARGHSWPSPGSKTGSLEGRQLSDGGWTRTAPEPTRSEVFGLSLAAAMAMAGVAGLSTLALIAVMIAARCVA